MKKIWTGTENFCVGFELGMDFKTNDNFVIWHEKKTPFAACRIVKTGL